MNGEIQAKDKLSLSPKKPPAPVSMQSKLKKSFNRAVLPLLNSVSKEDLRTAFPSCTDEEQRRLHQLFLKVIASLHGNIEDIFESLCDEVQVGAALDTFDRLLEEQSLDPLMTDKTNVLDTVRTPSMARDRKVQSLTRCLEKVG
ncbi:hypothetical protein MLD38_037658 [Melastoma candidum]|uniref:Uncharacterized protein n=1 Tax=Melastoma candidum TaxID=119954 RepID=A0ACB9LNP2_9MYRT|nr:hypothetical protein MLD38_037658 [Melastoma candidum]